uniref:Double Cache domain-containing protein n=1 Tax=Pseudomonas sp. 19-rlim TaxID=1084570 RepID=G3LGT3_9PSED|nr:hypothetical protein [Pseudomonas sp. 19-rlim]
MNLVLRVALFLLALLPGLQAFAQTAVDPAYQEEAGRARALLQKAIDFYKEQGDSAFPVFSRQGGFIDEQLYVYVVDTRGVMLASGGPSVMLIGRDVTSVLDPELKTVFLKALNEPEGQMRDAEYRWMNWNDGKVERKHAYYQRVGDRILAVGYYLPRANPAQARALLDQASDAIRENPEATFKAINDLDRRFYQDDLYVFAVALDTRRFVAHGYNQRLVGTDFQSLKSADGQAIGQSMLDAIKGSSEGELAYLWRNPVTNRSEHKHAYLRKVNGYLVAVGYYSR